MTLKFKLIGLQSLFKRERCKKAKLVLNINKKVTATDFRVKKEQIDPSTFSVYCKPFIHSFPVEAYGKLETPVIGNIWQFDIYCDGKCVLSKKSPGGIICERKRFVERCIGDYLERFLHYQVKFFSGSNNPDLIIKDPLHESATQVEVTEKTNSDGELTYEKFSRDIDKFERYQREQRFRSVKHLLIIPCAAGMQKTIKKHMRNYVTIVTFNDFYNLLCSLKVRRHNVAGRDTVKNLITNPGIQRAPQIYQKRITPYKPKRVMLYKFDLIAPSTTSESVLPSLLYVKDINPYELVKIVELAKNYDAEYMSTNKFKKILLEPTNLKTLMKHRPESTEERVGLLITRDRWTITPIHLGYMDENCKITEKGLFLLELLNQENFSDLDRETIRKLMGYDFLNAPGVKEFLKLLDECYSVHRLSKTHSSLRGLFGVLTQKMVEYQLSPSVSSAKKDCKSLLKWLRIFGYYDEYALDYEKIREDYTLEENA